MEKSTTGTTIPTIATTDGGSSDDGKVLGLSDLIISGIIIIIASFRRGFKGESSL